MARGDTLPSVTARLLPVHMDGRNPNRQRDSYVPDGRLSVD